jgi:hypothetical protein
MDCRTQTSQDAPGRDPSTDGEAGANPRPAPETEKGPTLNIGPDLVRTVRHFWPEINDWLDEIPDRRDQTAITYVARFLLWWGLSLFLFKLGSRRNLDFDLDARGTHVLNNINRLAGTEQTTRPVNKTLDDYLRCTGCQPLADLRTRLVRALLRKKVLDESRLLGYRLVLLDATGHLRFHHKHCERCLVRQHGSATLYLHQVLEAKLLAPARIVISIGTVFIENPDQSDLPADASEERRKQDCELKAMERLAPQLKKDFPQLPICLSGDGIYACGRALALAQKFDWRYVFIFKPGRIPSVWADFQSLLELCPDQKVEQDLPEGTRQVYRWVNKVSYTDSAGRTWTFNVIALQETKDGKTTTWAWVTDLPVDHDTVVAIALGGGRPRWCIENEGFNVQKNSELNLEHAYSFGAEQFKAFYYLLQIAHLMLQLLEKGSLLQQLAAEWGKTPLGLFGSLKNMAKRLLESVRNLAWPEEAFSAAAAKNIQIRLDSS